MSINSLLWRLALWRVRSLEARSLWRRALSREARSLSGGTLSLWRRALSGGALSLEARSLGALWRFSGGSLALSGGSLGAALVSSEARWQISKQNAKVVRSVLIAVNNGRLAALEPLVSSLHTTPGEFRQVNLFEGKDAVISEQKTTPNSHRAVCGEIHPRSRGEKVLHWESHKQKEKSKTH